MDDKVTLYIAEHNTTGLKYFGKTNRYFNQLELQEKYHGSGTRWKNHLKKHGDDVTMKIYGIFDKSEVESIALKFSMDYDIVESNEWANLVVENGLSGGSQGSGEQNPCFGRKHNQQTRGIISKRLTGKIIPKETRLKISKALCGNQKSEEHKNNMKKPKSNIHRQNIVNARIGMEFSEAHKQNISKSLKGKSPSEMTREKISRKLKGMNKPLTTCPHCLKEGGVSIMKRWHFDNCKYKDCS